VDGVTSVILACLRYLHIRLPTALFSAPGFQPVFITASREEREEQPSKCACRSIMQRQDDLVFLKAIPFFQVSPATLNELRLARKKRRPTMTSGRRISPYGSRASAFQQLAGKRKASELASLGDSTEFANRRPAPGTESSPLPATETATGEQAASGSRQPGPSGVGLHTRLYCPRPSPHCQVGRSSPQPRFRTRPNPVSRWRHQKGACRRTCPGL